MEVETLDSLKSEGSRRNEASIDYLKMYPKSVVLPLQG